MNATHTRQTLPPLTREATSDQFRLMRYISAWADPTTDDHSTPEWGISQRHKVATGDQRAGLVIPWAMLATGTRSVFAAANSPALTSNESTDYGAFQAALRPNSVLAQLGMQAIEAAPGYSRPEASGQLGQAAFVGEGYQVEGTITELTNRRAQFKNIVARVDATSLFQAQTASDGEQVIRSELLRSISAGIEAAMINGNPAGPVGLLNHPEVQRIDKQSNLLTYADLLEAREKLSDTCRSINVALSPKAAVRLALTEQATNSGRFCAEFYSAGPTERRLLGLLGDTEADSANYVRLWPGSSPASGFLGGITSHMPDGSIVIGDFSRLLAVASGGVEVVRNAYHPSVFQSGGLSMLAMVGVDLIISQPAASFVVIENIDWG